MSKTFLSNTIFTKYIIAILLLYMISCNNIKNEQEKCAVPNPIGCKDFITPIISKEGNSLPGDGMVYLEDRTFFITYFDVNSSKIIEKYLKIDCNCELIYFDEKNPIVKNSIN